MSEPADVHTCQPTKLARLCLLWLMSIIWHDLLSAFTSLHRRRSSSSVTQDGLLGQFPARCITGDFKVPTGDFSCNIQRSVTTIQKKWQNRIGWRRRRSSTIVADVPLFITHAQSSNIVYIIIHLYINLNSSSSSSSSKKYLSAHFQQKNCCPSTNC